MQKIAYSLIFVSLIMAFSCCKSSKSTKSLNKLQLVATQWNLTHIENEDIKNEFALRPFIIFDSAGTLRGNLGCNSFFGEYQLFRKNKIKIDYKGATKRLCDKMEVEKIFINAMKKDITNYKIEKNELILFSDKTEIMRFTGVDFREVE